MNKSELIFESASQQFMVMVYVRTIASRDGLSDMFKFRGMPQLNVQNGSVISLLLPV